jgi:hypothetical protein
VAAPTFGIRASSSFGAVACGESAASAAEAEALRGGAEVVFERDGINGVCRRNRQACVADGDGARRVSPRKKMVAEAAAVRCDGHGGTVEVQLRVEARGGIGTRRSRQRRQDRRNGASGGIHHRGRATWGTGRRPGAAPCTCDHGEAGWHIF